VFAAKRSRRTVENETAQPDLNEELHTINHAGMIYDVDELLTTRNFRNYAFIIIVQIITVKWLYMSLFSC